MAEKINIASLLAEAQQIGKDTADAKARLDSRIAVAKANAQDGEDTASGFASPQFQGIRKVAELAQRVIGNGQPWQDKHTTTLGSLAAVFVEGSTGKKSQGGSAGYIRQIVEAGNIGTRCLDTLQRVRDHYAEKHARAKARLSTPGESESARAEMETCERFLRKIGRAPGSENGPIEWVDDKKGLQRATHNGRPSKDVQVRGGKVVHVDYGGASDLLNIARQFVAIVKVNGAHAIDFEVAKALLDNGGKTGKVNMSALDHANAALGHVNDILTEIGDDPAQFDLRHVQSILSDILRRGSVKIGATAEAHDFDSGEPEESVEEAEVSEDSTPALESQPDVPEEVFAANPPHTGGDEVDTTTNGDDGLGGLLNALGIANVEVPVTDEQAAPQPAKARRKAKGGALATLWRI